MKLVRLGVLALGLSMPCAAMAAGPLWHRSVTLDYRVAPDGRADAVEVWEVRGDTLAIAHTLAQQSYSFIADMDEVELVSAYTRKADGRRIPVSTDAVLPQAVTTLAAAPQFSALTSRTIVFPNVGAGDVVHYELRRTGHATLFPGQFTLTLQPGSWAYLDRADISMTLPLGMVLHAAAANLEEAPAEAAADGGAVRRWRLAAKGAGTVVLDVSSLDGYEALGAAYAVGAWPQAQPGPVVQALADRLTEGAADPHEQALRLYRHVATEIRYVATFLGNGRVVPRAAEAVLAEGFGDCKDHASLLQALLAAKGIEAVPALISLQSLYSLPAAAGLGALNHVITYVPALELFLDSTAPYAPFGLLPAVEYDKPVVLAHPTRPRVGRTPPMPPGAIRLVTTTRARVGRDDVVSGETTTVAAGPQGIELRSMAAWFEGRGHSAAAGQQLRQLGTPGTGGFSFAPPEQEAADYAVTARFRLDDPLPDGGAAPFPLPSGLGVFDRPGKLLLGLSPTEDGGHVCFPGQEIEEIAFELPEGATIAALPRDMEAALGSARYTSRYWLVDGVLHARRAFAVDVAHQLCSKAEFDMMRGVLAMARRDQAAQVTLMRVKAVAVAHRD